MNSILSGIIATSLKLVSRNTYNLVELKLKRVQSGGIRYVQEETTRLE